MAGNDCSQSAYSDTVSDIIIPAARGAAALDELDRVDWDRLMHAYGTGRVPGDSYSDVPGALRLLSSHGRQRLDTPPPDDIDESFRDAMELLYANIWHQGTIYEATAHALPFLVAVAAGDEITHARRSHLVRLIADIAITATYDAPHGSHAGSWGGPDVAPLTRSALGACAPRLRALATDPGLHPIIVELLELPSTPTQSAQRLIALIDDE